MELDSTVDLKGTSWRIGDIVEVSYGGQHLRTPTLLAKMDSEIYLMRLDGTGPLEDRDGRVIKGVGTAYGCAVLEQVLAAKEFSTFHRSGTHYGLKLVSKQESVSGGN